MGSNTYMEIISQETTGADVELKRQKYSITVLAAK